MDKNSLLNLVISLIVSIFTAYLTVQFSIKKFRTERWWEEKVKVYNQILESLAHIRRFNYEIYNAEENGKSIPKSLGNELAKKAATGLNEIKRIEATGALIIDRKVTDRLTQFVKQYEFPFIVDKSFMDHIGDLISEIESCIEAIITYAKADLNIKK